MKVSVLNVNLIAEDAVGTCIINQVRFFRNRGDDVRLYVLYPPHDAPDDVQAVTRIVTLADLIGGVEEHFRLSDLYLYHYPGHYDLMESIRGIERGTAIFYYHNVTPPALWGSDAGREQLMRSLSGCALAHYADLCITDSPFNKQDLVERVGCDPDRVLVLPLAVPLDRFTPGDPAPDLVQRYGLAGNRILLYVGRMAGNKRIDLLVEALAQVQGQLPNTKLLLVGDDRSAPAFREIVAAARNRAEELGIAQDVVWTGRVDDLPAHYRLADVYVTASLHEGFGVPLIEAMASGVPIVASRAGAMPWLLDDAGLLCEPGNAEDLAEKVLRVLQDNQVRQTLIKRGLTRVQAFSLERYEAGLSEIIEAAIAYQPPDMIAPEQETGPSRKYATSAAQEEIRFKALVTEIKDQSDIAMRDYVVYSKAPLIGPVITWIRRNMTSHLREPYLDPIIERQVSVNRRIAEWLDRAVTAILAGNRRLDDLEAQVKILQDQIQSLMEPSDDQNGSR